MIFKKYRVFNHTIRKFETLITSATLEIGEFKRLPYGELQVIEKIKEF